MPAPRGWTVPVRAEREQWLRLLLARASGEEFADHARALRRAREPGEVDHELDLALRLRSQLEESSRRSHELASLNTISRHLVRIRDHRGVLRDIASQARQLLDGEMAFISLLGPSGSEMIIEVEAGTTTNAFTGMRLSADVGMGGWILYHRAPFSTSDYLNDARLSHDPGADRVTAGEGTTSMLGVPLLQGNAVLGVLFVADRVAREFTDHEIGLVVALAAHGAVAIDNARLFASNREAMVSLREANQELQDVNRSLLDQREIVRRSAEVMEGLSAVLIDQISIDDVLTRLAELIGAGVQCVTGLPLDAEVAAFPDHLAADGPADDSAPIDMHSGGLHLGSLVPAGAGVWDPMQRRLVEVAAPFVKVAIVATRARADAESRLREDFVSDLLGRTEIDDAVVHRQARNLGFPLEGSLRVAALLPGPNADNNVRQLLQRLTQQFAAVSGQSGEAWALVFSDSDIDQARAQFEATGPTATIAISGPVQGARGVIDAFRDARSACSSLHALGRRGEVVSTDELGIYRLLLANAAPSDVEAFVRAMLGPLTHSDRTRHTSLVATMEAVLEHPRLVDAATALGVHINTLYQRTDRITQLLGQDWRTPERRFDYQLAARLLRLAPFSE